MFMKITPEKANVREWLSVLSAASKGESYGPFFRKVHGVLAVPSRSRKAITLHKLDKHTKEGDNVIVPAKLLSTGKMTHKVNISVLECSDSASKALKGSGSRIVDIREMVKNKKVHLII
jgi:large subunit ribosomal protein L18e